MNNNCLVKNLVYDDLKIQINLGKIDVNVQYLRCMPFPSGWKNIRHCHPSYELHFIPFGQGKVILDDRIQDIKHGTFYLTGPGVYHLQMADIEDPMVEYCINFNINKGKNKENNISRIELDSMAKIILNTKSWFGDDLYGTISIFDRIFEELDKKMVGYNLTIASYITQIIVNTARSYAGSHPVDYELPVKTLDLKRENIIGIFLNERYGENIRLCDVAEVMCTSIRQTERIFKQVYGKGFKQVINAIRVEKATQLILDTLLPIELISQKVGFSSSGYFSKIFKDHTGQSPLELRKKNRRNASRDNS